MWEFFYGWDFFMENVLDFVYVFVLYYGFMGSRYIDNKYYDMI